MNSNDAFLSHLSSKVDLIQLHVLDIQNKLLEDGSENGKNG